MKPKDKREVPLRALQAVSQFIILDKGRFHQIETADAYCLITDPNPASNFYFKVNDATVNERGVVTISITRKPYNNITMAEMENGYDENGLVQAFKDWTHLVDSYEGLLSIKQDTILEAYTEEYYQEFELADEGADSHSFPFAAQLLLDAYFEKLIVRLETYNEDNDLSKTKQAEINQIVQDINELRETQTELTKQSVLQRLSGIWAKMRKAGFKLLGEAKTELMKEAIKQGVKGLLDNPKGPIDFVADMFNN